MRRNARREKQLTLAATMLGSFVAVLDSTVVSVARLRSRRRQVAASRCAGGQLVGAPSAVADAPDAAMPESTGPKTRDSDAALTRTRPSRADAKVTT